MNIPAESGPSTSEWAGEKCALWAGGHAPASRLCGGSHFRSVALLTASPVGFVIGWTFSPTRCSAGGRDESRARVVLARPGDLLLFRSDVWHSASVNLTGDSRWRHHQRRLLHYCSTTTDCSEFQ